MQVCFQASVWFLRASSGWIHLIAHTRPVRARSLAMLFRSGDNPRLAAEPHNGPIVWWRAAGRPAKTLTRDQVTMSVSLL